MATLNLIMKDETFAGKILNEISVAISAERLTVRELIAVRIHAEVKTYNQKLQEFFTGLVQPNDTEVTLNGYRMKKRALIDPEKQVYIALESFQQNGFFILIDNKQAESLDEEVLLGPQTSLSFIKLTPLVGG